MFECLPLETHPSVIETQLSSAFPSVAVISNDSKMERYFSVKLLAFQNARFFRMSRQWGARSANSKLVPRKYWRQTVQGLTA